MPIQPPSNIQTPPPSQLPQQPVKKSNKGLIIAIIAIVVALGAGAAYYFLYYEKNEPAQNVNILEDQNANETTNTNQLVIANNANSTLNVNESHDTNSVLVNAVSGNSNSTTTNTNTDDLVITNLGEILAELDTDGDELQDTHEDWYGTDKNKTDTDGDGFDDNIEVLGCYNPTGEGRMTNNNFISYCGRFLSQQYSGWGFEEEDGEINSICRIYEPVAVISIEQFFSTENDLTEDELDALFDLDSKCEELKASINRESENILSTDEDAICLLMMMAAGAFCI